MRAHEVETGAGGGGVDQGRDDERELEARIERWASRLPARSTVILAMLDALESVVRFVVREDGDTSTRDREAMYAAIALMRDFGVRFSEVLTPEAVLDAASDHAAAVARAESICGALRVPFADALGGAAIGEPAPFAQGLVSLADALQRREPIHQWGPWNEEGDDEAPPPRDRCQVGPQRGSRHVYHAGHCVRCGVPMVVAARPARASRAA